MRKVTTFCETLINSWLHIISYKTLLECFCVMTHCFSSVTPTFFLTGRHVPRVHPGSAAFAQYSMVPLPLRCDNCMQNQQHVCCKMVPNRCTTIMSHSFFNSHQSLSHSIYCLTKKSDRL